VNYETVIGKNLATLLFSPSLNRLCRKCKYSRTEMYFVIFLQLMTAVNKKIVKNDVNA
jgi:hypothetical protein